ncbi:hypothetical protein AB1Y20_000774 [Prymnesium parvum]|uniref:Macro domain-containing protein n=1 Tax=Prymnesium parvum TaxID=97485 RepID=A0AB34K9M3_PRYPA
MMAVELLLCDIDPTICELAAAAIRHSRLHTMRAQNVPLAAATCCEAVVHAGNSAAVVSSGQDIAFLELFGPSYQHTLQDSVRSLFCDALQPVGTALLVPVDHPTIAFVVHAPCFPQQPKGAYEALSAALKAVHRYNEEHGEMRVRGLACAAMGAYRGCSSQHSASVIEEMVTAYQDYLSTPTCAYSAADSSSGENSSAGTASQARELCS